MSSPGGPFRENIILSAVMLGLVSAAGWLFYTVKDSADQVAEIRIELRDVQAIDQAQGDAIRRLDSRLHRVEDQSKIPWVPDPPPGPRP